MAKLNIIDHINECPHCGIENAGVLKEDVGIGSYEFWGQKCVDTRYAYFCEACGEELEDYEEEEPDYPEYEPDEPPDMPDNEADADTLRSAGMGTDEDYGYFGEHDGY